MVKPHVDILRVAELLNGRFGQPVERLAPVGTGQIASVFAFGVAGQEYIIRFVTSKMAASFGKDQFAFRRLSSSSVPVPPIIHTGVFDDLRFALSPRFPGVPLDQLSDEEHRRSIPAIIDTLDAIHQTDIGDTNNFGFFDDRGVGLSRSWPEYLLSVADEEPEEGFYGKWHWMFDETFLDRGLFESIYRQMEALLKYCPAERFLVHADYGFGNVLAQDGRITAVLDWANAVYGDFLYDVAWLDLGCPGFDYQSRFQEYYRARNRSIPHYRERVVCYQCYISLDSQRWYAKTGKLKNYEWMRSRILGILQDGPDRTNGLLKS